MSDLFSVRSSNINRTIESLQCVVAGMFGVEQFRENGNIPWPLQWFFITRFSYSRHNPKTLCLFSRPKQYIKHFKIQYRGSTYV